MSFIINIFNFNKRFFTTGAHPGCSEGFNTPTKRFSTAGFTIIEVLIACAIISASSFALISASQKGIELSNQALRQVQAGLLLEEGVEAVKTIRDNSWSNISALTVGSTYYLSFNTSTNVWSLTTTQPSALDGLFTRNIVVSAVYRDSNDDISSSGSIDTFIKRVTVTVSWPRGSGTSSKTITFYLADIFT